MRKRWDWCLVEDPPHGRSRQERSAKGVVACERIRNREDVGYGQRTIVLGGGLFSCMPVKVPCSGINLPSGYWNIEPFHYQQGLTKIIRGRLPSLLCYRDSCFNLPGEGLDVRILRSQS